MPLDVEMGVRARVREASPGRGLDQEDEEISHRSMHSVPNCRGHTCQTARRPWQAWTVRRFLWLKGKVMQAGASVLTRMWACCLEMWAKSPGSFVGCLFTMVVCAMYCFAAGYYDPSSVTARSLDSSLPPSMPVDPIVKYEAKPFDDALWQQRGKPFHVFFGPHHSGKTVCVTRNLNEMQQQGRAVFYAVANEDTEPLWTVREALGIPQQDPWLMVMLSKVGAAPRWPDTLEGFGKLLATVAARRSSTVPLIVVDEVNALEEKDAKKLVLFAKHQADHGAVHVVLMMSPGIQAQAVLAASASSRGELVLMPDPPMDAVKSFLVNLHVSDIEQKKVYELTGGRWEHLDRVRRHLRDGKFDFDDFKNTWIQAQRDRVAVAANLAECKKADVFALLRRVLHEGPVEVVKEALNATKQLEHRIAMACVAENLLLTVMTVQKTMNVDFHSPMVRAMVQEGP